MANYRAKLALVCLLLAASVHLLAQGPGQVSTVRHGSALPTACTPTQGQIFFLNNDGLYSCTATNTWTKGSAGGGSWGSITGTLSAQTDLNTALNGKVPTTRAVAGHPLSADVAIACADLSNDGDACAKNTGTTTGTLAAGDDSRIVNAVPNTRTVAGKALSTNITLASTDLTDSANVVKTNAAATFGAFSYDFAGSTHFRPVGGLTASKPATCNPPEVYFATDATAGQNWYFCTATNTWTQQLNSGGGGNTTSTSLTANALSKANGANSIINSLFADDGTNGAYSGTGGFAAPKLTSNGAGGGQIGLNGSTSGTVTISVPAVAGANTVTLPDATGTVALVGADINTSNQVTVTHLAAALPIAQGGTNNTTATDDTVLIGNGTTLQQKTIPACTDTLGNHLNYDQATNTLLCGTSSSGGGGGGTGTLYPLVNTSGSVLTANSTFYLGNNVGRGIGDQWAKSRMYVPHACTVKAVFFHIFNSSGTWDTVSENLTAAVGQNNVTFTSAGTFDMTGSGTDKDVSLTGLSIALSAGDYIALRIQTPTTYTTTPSGVNFSGYIECE